MARKVSKASVNYRHASPTARQKCGNCSMFQTARSAKDYGGSCTLVAGRILRIDVCDRWEAKR